MFRSALITLSALCLMQVSAQAQVSPADLGWQAGVVAPSPLKGTWEGRALSDVHIAQRAKAEAQAEISRVGKLRQAHLALCGEKFFVNACVNKAERVLRERELFANQLLRSADHQLRQFEWKKKQQQARVQPERKMPARKADASHVTDEQLKAQGKPVTEQARQETANEMAYQEKLKEQEERRARLKAEAQKRKERREARRARHEAEKAKREEAERYQAAQKDKKPIF